MADDERRDEEQLIEEATTAYQKGLKPLNPAAPEFKPGGRKSRRKGGKRKSRRKSGKKTRKGGKWSY